MAPGEYKPNQYVFTPYKPSKQPDAVKFRDYKLSTFKPSEFKSEVKPYEYKPYQPSHVGMYGERQRPKPEYTRPVPQTPPPRPTRKPRKTFQCYKNPMGPDIKVKPYEPTEYKPTPYKPSEFKPSERGDPLKRNAGIYKSEKLGMYKGSGVGVYKLTEENNPGMRHFRNYFVDDTVARWGGGTPRPEEKYRPEEDRKRKAEPKQKETKPKTPEPKLKKSKTPDSPKTWKRDKENVQPVFAPIPARTPSPAPPKKKQFKTQPTQTQPVKMSTHATQSEQTKTKTSSIQTKTPLPIQAVAPVPLKSQTKTKSSSVQTNTPLPLQTAPVQNKVPTKGMAIQTTPGLEPVKRQNEASPVRTRPRESPNDVYYESREPSPEIVPVVFAANPGNHYRRDQSTNSFASRDPSPEVTSTNHRRDPSPQVVPIPLVGYNSRGRSTPKYDSPQNQRRNSTPIYQQPTMPRENSGPSNGSPVVVAGTNVYTAPSPKYESQTPRRSEASVKNKSVTPKYESPKQGPPFREHDTPLTDGRESVEREPSPWDASPIVRSRGSGPRYTTSPQYESPVPVPPDSVHRGPSPRYDSTVVMPRAGVHKAPTQKQQSPVVQPPPAQSFQTPSAQQPQAVEQSAPSPKYQSPKKSVNRAPTPIDEFGESPVQSEPTRREPTPKQQSPARKPSTPKQDINTSRSERTSKTPKPLHQSPMMAPQNAAPYSTEGPKSYAQPQAPPQTNAYVPSTHASSRRNSPQMNALTPAAHASPQRNAPNDGWKRRLPPEITANIEAYDNAHSLWGNREPDPPDLERSGGSGSLIPHY